MSRFVESIVKWVIPKFVRKMGWSYVRGIQKERRIQESEAIPYYELQSKHLRHAKVLLNREDLLAHLPHGGVVAECGVDEGVFSEKILAITVPRRLHLIDVWNSERYHSDKALTVKQKFGEQINDGRVEINCGYSTAVLSGFDDGYFDWIYIDTDHTYETTVKELRIAARKVKAGGIIAGHDYVTGNWNKAVRYGVVEAIHEFCVKEDWQIVYLTAETHQHRSFAICAIDS